jgi:beta-galactosidase
LLNRAGIRPVLGAVDPDIEVSARTGAGRCVVIAINHGTTVHPLALPTGARVIAGSLDRTALPPHAVAVVHLGSEETCT